MWPISSPYAPLYSVVKSNEYVAKIQTSLSPRHSSPENSVSIVLLLPLAKSVGVCVFEWFLVEAKQLVSEPEKMSTMSLEELVGRLCMAERCGGVESVADGIERLLRSSGMRVAVVNATARSARLLCFFYLLPSALACVCLNGSWTKPTNETN